MTPPEASGWQPIETAPRDGRHIIAGRFGPSHELLWVKDTHWDTAEGAAQADGYTAAQADDYETGWQNADAFMDGTCGPTHWMPLPAPPSTPATRVEGQGEAAA